MVSSSEERTSTGGGVVFAYNRQARARSTPKSTVGKLMRSAVQGTRTPARLGEIGNDDTKHVVEEANPSDGTSL